MTRIGNATWTVAAAWLVAAVGQPPLACGQDPLGRGEREVQSYLRQSDRAFAARVQADENRFAQQAAAHQGGVGGVSRAAAAVPHFAGPPHAPHLRHPNQRWVGSHNYDAWFADQRLRQVQLQWATTAEMAFWNQASGYGLNGVVPLDVPFRNYVATNPFGFTSTLVNPYQPFMQGHPGLYPGSVYYEPGLQPTGAQVIPTGPNSYVYGPTYGGLPATDEPAPGAARPAAEALPRGVGAEAELERMQKLFQQRRYRELTNRLDRVLDRWGDDGRFYLLLGQTLFAQMKYAEAADALRQAIRLLPEEEWGSIVENHASYYAEDYVFPRQLDGLEARVRRQPRDSEARFVLAFQLGFLGHADEAAELLATLRDSPSDDHVSVKLRGYFEAIADEERAAEDARRGPPPPPEPEADEFELLPDRE